MGSVVAGGKPEAARGKPAASLNANLTRQIPPNTLPCEVPYRTFFDAGQSLASLRIAPLHLDSLLSLNPAIIGAVRCIALLCEPASRLHMLYPAATDLEVSNPNFTAGSRAASGRYHLAFGPLLRLVRICGRPRSTGAGKQLGHSSANSVEPDFSSPILGTQSIERRPTSTNTPPLDHRCQLCLTHPFHGRVCELTMDATCISTCVSDLRHDLTCSLQTRPATSPASRSPLRPATDRQRVRSVCLCFSRANTFPTNYRCSCSQFRFFMCFCPRSP